MVDIEASARKHGVRKTRAERAAALEEWAEAIDSTELHTADTDSLRHIAELAQQRDDVEAELAETVRAARTSHRSWSEIGTMLGVSKQAAQRKYGTKATTSTAGEPSKRP